MEIAARDDISRGRANASCDTETVLLEETRSITFYDCRLDDSFPGGIFHRPQHGTPLTCWCVDGML